MPGLSNRVAVMTSGQIVKTGPAAEIDEHPQHEYPRTLLDAIPAETPAEARRRRANAEYISPT